MRVSIIIPVYNEEGVIGDCLRSLEKQNIRDFEVVVVDDGSNDRTFEILSEIRISNFKFRVLRQEHKGAGAARNLGAKRARGEILVFVDADMTFNKNFIRKLIAPIMAGRAVGSYTNNEEVSNWENVWARCWNYNEGIRGKSRQRRLKRGGPGWWLERMAFMVSERNISEKKFEEEMAAHEKKVLRAVIKERFEKVGGYTPGGYTDDYTLGEKMEGAKIEATEAKIYHRNPDSLKEVFRQARWAGKRRYRMGWVGLGVAAVRVCFPVTAIAGIMKAVRYRSAAFVIFKVVYNTGITMGLISYYLFGRGAK